MILNPHIFYHLYGEHLYIRNVKTNTNYLYNDIVFDILEYVKNNNGCDNWSDLCSYLSSLYELNDISIEEFEQDIQTCLIDLKNQTILIDNETSTESEPYITNVIHQFCNENTILDALCLELTYRCNEHCIHCYVENENYDATSELTLTEYKHLIDEAHLAGCFRLLLTGGEVCIRKDWLTIAEYAISKGMLVDIYTNGLALTENDFIKLCTLNINSISFSLYGGDAITHDKITGIKGSFDKTLQSLMMCKCAGFDTFIKSVAMKQNIHSIESLYQLGKRLQIPVKTSLIIAAKNAFDTASQYRINDIELYQKLIAMDDYYNNNKIISDTTDCFITKALDTPTCSCGKNSLAIDPFGNIYPCNAYKEKLGNIKTDSLLNIWEHSKKLKEIRNIRFRDVSNKCLSCPDIMYCPICIGFAQLEKNKPSFCEDVCLVARAKHNNARKEELL